MEKHEFCKRGKTTVGFGGGLIRRRLGSPLGKNSWRKNIICTGVSLWWGKGKKILARP